MMFVGYPLGKKGYKMFKPSNNRFAYSRDLTFVENSFTFFKTSHLAGQVPFNFETPLDYIDPTSTFFTFCCIMKAFSQPRVILTPPQPW